MKNTTLSSSFYKFFFLVFLVLSAKSLVAQKLSLQGAEIPSFNQELSNQFSEYQTFQINTQALAAENRKADDFQLYLQLGDKYDWNINLTTSQIITPNYREILGTENGPIVLPARKNIAYTGYLPGTELESRLTLDENWIMGFITLPNGEKIYIESLANLQTNAPSNQYIVYPGHAVLNNNPGGCGSLLASSRAPIPAMEDHNNDPSDDPIQLTNVDCKEADFSVASAFDMINNNHNTPASVLNYTVSITNMMQTYFEFLPIQYLLNDNYVSTSTSADPFFDVNATNTDILLPEFADWAQNAGIFSDHDVAQVWTARNITGCGIGPNLIGCAYVNVICGDFRYNICEDFSPNNIQSISLLSAHELGHNWNCRHADAGVAPFNIMNASLNSSAIGFGPNSMTKIMNAADLADCLSDCGDPDPPSPPNCTAQADFPFQEWIEDVSFGSLENLGSGKFRDFSTAGYSDFTDLDPAAINRTNPVDYTFNIGNSGANPGDFWTAFIDYNQNNIFDLPEEEVLRRRGESITGEITIPANVLSGTALLRIILSKDGFSGPCENPDFGEVEDYLIDISGSSPPSGLADLVISGLSVQGQGNPNEIVDFSIGLSNIGSAGTGSFSLGVFLSTDNQLSSNDPLIGEIPTGNFDPNFSIQDIPGVFNLAGINPGNYFLFFKIDKDEVIPELNENNNTRRSSFRVIGDTGGGDIDLELSMSASVPNPDRFSRSRITLTLTNNSEVTATNVETAFRSSPGNFVFSGDGAITITGGGTFSAASGAWRIPSINGGGTATVSFDLFTLSENFNPCAEVVLADQDDSDSTPRNGNCPNAVEDDEANLSDIPPTEDGVDIAVDLSVSNSSPDVFSKIFYQVTVINQGIENATGLSIDFDYGAQEDPRRLSLVNNPNSNYNDWEGIWTIGTLPAGEARSFELEVFVLPAASPSTTLTAEIRDLDQPDNNSSNDLSSTTIFVDAGATLNEGANSYGISNKRPSLSINNIFPNPTTTEITVAIHSLVDQSAIPLEIFNAFGKMILREKINLSEGANLVRIPVQTYAEGVYLVVLPTGSHQNLVKRFVKVRE